MYIKSISGNNDDDDDYVIIVIITTTRVWWVLRWSLGGISKWGKSFVE